MINERTRKVILHLFENEFSNNNDINEIFIDTGLNINHINRMKNDCIREVNLKFFKIFDSNLIIKIQSLKDKRMIFYRLNPNLKFVIKN